METLREFRRRRGWSQKDLASESGVGQDTISSIETGAHEPRPSTLRKLAEALDVEVADFFREPVLPGKAEAPRGAGPSMADFLNERCGHAYLTRNLEDVRQRVRTTDPLMIEGIMDQLRQERDALGEERKKYPVTGRWRWDEDFTTIMWKYLSAGHEAQARSPERQEALRRLVRELEGKDLPESEFEAS